MFSCMTLAPGPSFPSPNTRESDTIPWNFVEWLASSWSRSDEQSIYYLLIYYLTITLRARVFYEQIVNEAQPSWLSLVENEGE